MTAAKLPVLANDQRLWERQPWDTDASYAAFALYYFSQKPPRSVNEAYRTKNPIRVAKGQQDARNAPSNWRRWSTGKDPKNRQKYYILQHDDGTQETKIVPSWADRAQAFDDHQLKLAREKAAKEIQETTEKMQQTLHDAAKKLATAWSRYNPSGDENIATLAQATDRLVNVLGHVFDMFGDGDQDDGRQKARTDQTDMQRVDEIAKIIGMGLQRKKQAEQRAADQRAAKGQKKDEN